MRFAVDFDSGVHSQEQVFEYVEAIEGSGRSPLYVHFSQRLVISRQEIPLSPPRFAGQVIDWRAELKDVLALIPAYVRVTLRNLNRVHAVISSGTDQFYMLDFRGSL